jgi:alpha-D-ribose 1-methylphosphonate 5-triphosphate synthase subunit PhnI
MTATLGIEEAPAAKPSRKRITEELMSQIAGVSEPSFRELVRLLRGLDEAAQADKMLTAIELKAANGDIEGAKRLVRVFTALFPRYSAEVG